LVKKERKVPSFEVKEEGKKGRGASSLFRKEEGKRNRELTSHHLGKKMTLSSTKKRKAASQLRPQ